MAAAEPVGVPAATFSTAFGAAFFALVFCESINNAVTTVTAASNATIIPIVLFLIGMPGFVSSGSMMVLSAIAIIHFR
jgi:hypothetical protein